MQCYSAVVEGLQLCLRHRLVRFKGLVDNLRHGEDSLFLQHLPRELKADRGVLERLWAVCDNDIASSFLKHEHNIEAAHRTPSCADLFQSRTRCEAVLGLARGRRS